MQIKVVHVSNATRLWVSILEHFPITRGGSSPYLHDPLVFKQLTLDLSHYYSEKENKKYHGKK